MSAYSLKAKWQKVFLKGVKKSFPWFEKTMGIHITPVHYYSPIPATFELKPSDFSRRFSCEGLDWNTAQQMDFVDKVFPSYVSEYAPAVNSGLSKFDAFVLYSLIRHFKPKNMIEIGSGESTKIALAAHRKNAEEGTHWSFTAIEPYPKPFLKNMSDPQFRLIEKKVQDVGIEDITNADLLFIDSSHVAKFGSDVLFEVLEILPRLKKGAVVHFHDIPLPFDYSETWVKSGTKFWNESYIVHAFLLFNSSFKILWGSRKMQIDAAERLNKFSFFEPSKESEQNSSLWIQRVT